MSEDGDFSARDGDMDPIDSTMLDPEEMSEVMTLDHDTVSSPPPSSSDDDDDNCNDGNEVKEPVDMTRVSFSAHSGSTFCCCVSANGAWAASGGEDDSCAVWRIRRSETNIASSDPFARVTCGVRDSVVQVAFNCDDSRLAVADMSGTVCVFDFSRLSADVTGVGDNPAPNPNLPSNASLPPTPNPSPPASNPPNLPSSPTLGDPATLPLLCQMDTDGDLNWLQWHSHSPGVLLAGTARGDMWMWLVSTRPQEPKSRLVPGHGSGCTCATVAPPQGLLVMLGYEDGTVRVVEMRSGEGVARFAGGGSRRGGHEAGVTCVRVRSDGKLALSASEDGTVVLYRMTDTGSCSVLSSLCCTSSGSSVAGDGDGGVEQADFFPSDNSLMVSVSTAGLVLVWDVTSARVRHRLHVPSGASRLCWAPPVSCGGGGGRDPSGCHFYVGCLDASVLRVNAKSGAVEKRLTVRSPCHLLDMCVSSKSVDTLVTALDDGRLCVFDLT